MSNNLNVSLNGTITVFDNETNAQIFTRALNTVLQTQNGAVISSYINANSTVALPTNTSGVESPVANFFYLNNLTTGQIAVEMSFVGGPSNQTVEVAAGGILIFTNGYAISAVSLTPTISGLIEYVAAS